MNKNLIIAIVAGVAVIAAIAIVAILLIGGGSIGHTHAYGEWETTKAASCTVDGNKVRICECGEQQTQSIAATGHEYDEWTIVKEATCDKTGSKERICKCGDKQTRTIAATGHKYGEWSVVKEASCTEAGSKERFCECGDTQTQSIIAEHSYSMWIVDLAATCGSTGSKHSTCSACGDTKTETIPKTTSHNYNEGVVTKEATCSIPGVKTMTCTICGTSTTATILALGHNVDNTGACKRCGLVTLNMTSTEIEKSKTIKTISYSVSEYSYEIDINITLKDKNSYSVQVPVYVDVKIVDDNGNILYSKTIIKKSSQSKITIDYDEITPSFTNTGTLYYTVYNDYASFDTISKELENIPWTVTIELPNVPQIISDTGYRASSCKVTGITYKVSGDNVTFYFTGEKTYDENGSNYSQSCKIGWKLYDEDGYVVDDGTCYTTSLKVGEKFKDAGSTAYDVIEQGKTYRLVIMNVS